MSLPRSVRFNYDDFLLFPDDGKRHEIIDGDHFMTPSPNTKHQRVSFKLSSAFASFLEIHCLGEVFTAPYDVILSDEDVVEPDLLFVSTARRAIITEKNIQGPPDLVVEILSPSNTASEMMDKEQLCLENGAREFWQVDTNRKQVKVTSSDGRTAHYKTGQRIPLFFAPVESITVDAIFA